jgi:transcriptional regulator with XRE-family HTH domain
MSDKSSVPWLREAREARGLSQQELAALLRVSHATISRWESGERNPKYPTRVLLERILRRKKR